MNDILQDLSPSAVPQAMDANAIAFWTLFSNLPPPALRQAERIDYEYKRLGTANLFFMVEPLVGWRHVEMTEQRTKRDYAECIRWLVDDVYPHAEYVRIVQDNLNTHIPLPCMKSCLLQKRTGSCDESSFITLPNMPVG